MTRLNVTSSVAHESRNRRIADSVKRAENNPVASKFLGGLSSLGVTDIKDSAVTAGLLANFAKIMDSAKAMGKTALTGIADSKDAAMFTTTGDYGPYVMQVWPLITAWYSEFPLKDLISVQDMDQDLGYIFASRLLTGTTQAPTVAGDVVETPWGPRNIHGSYPNGQIIGEKILQTEAQDGKYMTAYDAIRMNDQSGRTIAATKIEVYSSADALTASYVASGVTSAGYTFKTSAGAASDVVLSPRGVISGLTIAEGGYAKVSYYRDLDYADQKNIQRIKENVERVIMQAEPRALELEWTIFADYLRKSQFGQDLKTSNTQRILSLLYQFDTRLVLDEMYTFASGKYQNAEVAEITLQSGTEISLEVKIQNVLSQLKAVANQIEINSGRIEGNRIVCGRNFKAFVESLPEVWFKRSADATNYGFSTPRHIGTFSTFEVYYDPAREANEGFMTYRGDEWYDAAYYMGVYMPVVPTDVINIGVTLKEAFCSMEAYLYHKHDSVIKLNFQWE